MKAEELRIGNSVQYASTGLHFFVGSINKDGLDVYNDIESTWIEIDQFEPIPLTEEWLVRLGFEDRGSIFKLSSILIRYDEGKFYFIYNEPFLESIEIKFVHQLQNLFYALKGSELTIKETAKE
jgi:hypothetical protein